MIGQDECAHDPHCAPLRLQDRLFWTLGRAARQAERETRARLDAVGLRHGYYGVLASIVEFGPASQIGIARRLGLDRSDMVAILNDLETGGLISRETDPADRRRNIVTITRDGRRALARFDRAIGEVEDELLADFSPSERATAVRLIQRLAAKPTTGHS